MTTFPIERLLKFSEYRKFCNCIFELDMSEECKNILSVIYYMYLCDDNERNNLIDIWFNN